jgi:hypothetical protein
MFQQMPFTMVSFDSMPDGLYLVKRSSQYPLIEHYGVLIIGAPLWSFGIYSYEPVILHRTDVGVLAAWANQTGTWGIVGQVPQQLVPSAVARFSEALQKSDYNLFTNNCEQFARYVTEGQEHSTQVGAAVIVGALAIMAWGMTRSNS